MRFDDWDPANRDHKLGFTSLTEVEKAYLAGLIDGEGCIRITTLSGRATVPEGQIGLYLHCANTHKGVLEDLVRAFGGHLHSKPRDLPHYKLCWNWSASGKRAAQALWHLEPYLRIKRPEAQAALMFAETYFAEWRMPEDRKRLTDDARHMRRAVHSFFRNHAHSGRRQPR